MNFGQRIKLLRQEKGYTQSQLGKFFGLAESTISLYESHKRSPDYETLKSIAHFFAVSIDYLVGYSDNRYTSCNVSEQHDISTYCKNAILDNATNYRWIQHKGDSMCNDGILDKDLALINSEQAISYGDIALVKADGGEEHLCRIYLKENSIILQYASPHHPPRIFAGTELTKVKCLGKVIEIRRYLP